MHFIIELGLKINILMSWFKEDKKNLILNIYVIPRSSRSEIVGIYNDSLKIKLKSPPVDNAANEELIRFLSEKFKTSKSNIDLVKGHNQKRKVLKLINVSLETIKALGPLL